MDNLYYLPLFLLSAVNIVPYAVGCYIPYWNQLTVRRSILIPLLCLLFTTETLVLGFFPDDLSFNLVFFALNVINLFIFLRTVDAKNGELLFTFLLFAQFGSVIRGISFFVETNFIGPHAAFSLPATQSYVLVYSLELLLSIAIIIPIGLNLKNHFVPLMNTVNIRQWRILFTIPLVFVAMILALVIFFDEQVDNPFYLLLIFIMAVGSAIIYVVIFRILRGLSDNAALREQNLELGFREQYYTLLSSRIEATRQARHDFRHHLRLLAAFLESGDYDSAKEYLEEYTRRTDVDEDFLYCANPAANLILNHYTALAHGSGIKMDISAKLPESCFVSTSDLCVLLGNILENAIEGCQRQPENEARWIQVRLVADEHKMAAAIDNSCGEINLDSSGEFLSTKNNRQGIGLSSLRTVAKKYGGSAWFEEASGVFKSSVVLHS